MSNLSNGWLERQLKQRFKQRCRQQRLRCAYCRQPIDYDAPRNAAKSFEAAHKLPVKTHPHLGYDESNLMPSHSKCNRAEGAKPFEESQQWTVADWG
jgi:5-methylcytosine-specific restriction endonuclease McrA